MDQVNRFYQFARPPGHADLIVTIALLTPFVIALAWVVIREIRSRRKK